MRGWKRKALSVGLIIGMLTHSAAFAGGPGEAVGMTGRDTSASLQSAASAPAGSESKMVTNSAWYGYKNADGSDFTYVERGTEVSKFQNLYGEIDWDAVKADGMDFVMVRISFGLTEDAYFDENVSEALAAGLKVGAYVCSTAKNMEGVEKEAQLAVSKISKYNLQYPVAYDVEVNSILSEGATKSDLTAMSNRFCEIIRNAGYLPILYANKEWLEKYIDVSGIHDDVWYAAYVSDKVYRPVEGCNTTIWQSGEAGTVNGIKGTITTEFSKVAYNGLGGTRSSSGGASGSGQGAVAVGPGGVEPSASSGPQSDGSAALPSGSSGTGTSGQGGNDASPVFSGGDTPVVSSGPAGGSEMESGIGTSGNGNGEPASGVGGNGESTSSAAPPADGRILEPVPASSGEGSSAQPASETQASGGGAGNGSENEAAKDGGFTASEGVISSFGPAGSIGDTPAFTPQDPPSPDTGVYHEGSAPGTMSASSVSRSGWIKNSNGKWLFYENGRAAQGWKLIDKAWYYFGQDGIMADRWAKINNVWYWLGLDGAMRTGWKIIDNVWYYMEESGAMLQGTSRMIDGVMYSFDQSGAWIG